MGRKPIEVVAANQTILIEKTVKLLEYLAAKDEKFLGPKEHPHYPQKKEYFDQTIARINKALGFCTGMSFAKVLVTLMSRNKRESKENSLPIHDNDWFIETRQLLAKWTPETDHSYSEEQRQSMLLFIQQFIFGQDFDELTKISIYHPSIPLSAWPVTKDNKPLFFQQIGQIPGFYSQTDLTKILTEILKKDRFIFLSSVTHVGVLFINDVDKIEFFDSNHDNDGVIYPSIEAVVDYFSTQFPDICPDVLLPIILWTYTSSPADNLFPSVKDIAKLCHKGELAYSPEIPGYFNGVASIHISESSEEYLSYWFNDLSKKNPPLTAKGIVMAVRGDQKAFSNSDQDEKNAYLKAIDHRGQSILMHAIIAKRFLFAESLLTENINLNVQDKFGWTALMYAAQHPESDLFAKLLNKGADPFIRAQDGKSIIDILREKKNKSAVKALLSYRSPGGKTLLMQAIAKNDTDSIRILCSLTIEVNARDHAGRTALFYAAVTSNKFAIELLLKAKADLTIQEKSGKIAVDYAKKPEIIKILAPKVLSEGQTPLMLACRNNDLRKIRELLLAKVDLSTQDRGGRTALFYAVIFGNPEVVGLLLTANADPLLEDCYQKSALKYASEMTTGNIYTIFGKPDLSPSIPVTPTDNGPAWQSY